MLLCCVWLGTNETEFIVFQFSLSFIYKIRPEAKYIRFSYFHLESCEHIFHCLCYPSFVCLSVLYFNPAIFFSCFIFVVRVFYRCFCLFLNDIHGPGSIIGAKNRWSTFLQMQRSIAVVDGLVRKLGHIQKTLDLFLNCHFALIARSMHTYVLIVRL